MPILVSLHDPFYMHIIRYRKTPPPYAHILVFKDAPLCVLVQYYVLHTHLSLHMPIFVSPKATLSICSEVAPLYIPILASPNTQLSMCLCWGLQWCPLWVPVLVPPNISATPSPIFSYQHLSLWCWTVHFNWRESAANLFSMLVASCSMLKHSSFWNRKLSY